MNVLKWNILRRVVVAAAVVTLSLSAGASAQAQLSNIGLRLGYNTASMYPPYSTFGDAFTWGAREKISGSAGFHAGFSADVVFAEVDIGGDMYAIGISPNALFTSKNVALSRSFRIGSISYNSSYDIGAYYLDIPVPVTVKKDFGSYKLKAEFGPYVAIGLFGDKVYSVPGANLEWREPTFGGEVPLTRVDGGLFYGVTVEFVDRYFLGLRYGSGLTDQSVGSAYLTLGYNIQL